MTLCFQRSVVVAVYVTSAAVLAAQSLPFAWQGTWQLADRNVYEHWDSISPVSMMGLTFIKTDSTFRVVEYLSMEHIDGRIVYWATVKGQNQGRSIPFTLHQPDQQTWQFENPDHDFPTLIRYHHPDPNILQVTVSGPDKHYSMTLLRK